MPNVLDTMLAVQSTNTADAKKEVTSYLKNFRFQFEGLLEGANNINEIENVCLYLESLVQLTQKIDCKYCTKSEYGMVFENLIESVKSYQCYKDPNCDSNKYDIANFRRFGLEP